MKNLYWHVYQNLEKELLDIGDTVFIVDGQLDVYSVRIADLLVRTCVEIESIAKELYFANGGPKPREKRPYFDQDCLGFLNDKWLITYIFEVDNHFLNLGRFESTEIVRFLLQLNFSLCRYSEANKGYCKKQQ